jgi:hypothetical protein
MLISPADLRVMLRADAVELVLGVLLMLTGLLTVALVGVLRQRVALLLWIGAFSTPGPGSRQPTISRSCSSIGRAGRERPARRCGPLARAVDHGHLVVQQHGLHLLIRLLGRDAPCTGTPPSVRYFDDVNGNE